MNAPLLLIVESDSDFCRMLRIHFQSQRYEVMIAQCGQDALEMCRCRLPDIIILNARLPDIYGYDVFHRLRDNVRTGHIPIIFLTQADERSDILHGLGLGADDYITINESFDLKELELRVRNKLPRTQTRSRKKLPRTGGRMLVV